MHYVSDKIHTTTLGAYGARSISAVVRAKSACPKLEVVNLKYNKIGGLGIKHLDEAFNNPGVMIY
jgi:hypothetical protein